ncbi:unnamed protein product [Phytophthora fragariaefolia]|uniref:Nascent polypeptide-associated complex subunit beta n=1 Tax=Phytophthora fragariaefolia TaxID=1490495 RepID=A0A9W6TN28_9STRA|nr:unnamed protein product [Phytophthora fragariaefolia]
MPAHIQAIRRGPSSTDFRQSCSATYELDEADFALDDGLHGAVVAHGGHDDAEEPRPPHRVREEEGHERHAELQQRDGVARVAVLAGGDRRGYGGKRNLTDADLAEVKKLSAKKPKKKSKKPKNAAAGGEDAEPQAPRSLYRDRAAERRRGETGDMIDAEEFKHFNADQSKFLGGDMEHTHLVKGLDYALLAQLKREKQKLRAEKEKHVQAGTGNVQTARPRDGKLTFKSRMGRLVYFHACQSTPETTASVKSELFLPGRMYYTFNLSTAEIESVPVSVQRSKDDCPEPDEILSGIVDNALIDRVKELMNSKTSGKKLRKKKKDDHQQNNDRGKNGGDAEHPADADEPMEEAAVEAVIDDDDEDIFPDVGEFVPIDQRVDDASADASKKEAIKEAGYFSNLSASITEKEEAARKREEDAERAWKETLQKAVDTQKRIEREKERKAKEAKMTGTTDDYAEYQAVGALPDSDDEDDEETARRRKAAGLTDRKGDVDPEEKARRKKQKQNSKMANDLEKINKRKAAHKTATADDKKLGATLKKLGVTPIPGVEEVNLFKADGQVIHFQGPKVQASIASNTYAVSGFNQTKSLQELLPGIINQLGPDNLANLKQIAESYTAAQKAAKAASAAAADDDDDEVPDLVDNFEDVSQQD